MNAVAPPHLAGAPSVRHKKHARAPSSAKPGAVAAHVRQTPPVSLEGWVSYPTPRPHTRLSVNRPPRSGKAGVCGTPASYGIVCVQHSDQCSTDAHCPGPTLCCLVAQCGHMCVTPAAERNMHDTEVSASKVLKMQAAQDQLPETSTMTSGLKPSDVVRPPNHQRPARHLRYLGAPYAPRRPRSAPHHRRRPRVTIRG